MEKIKIELATKYNEGVLVEVLLKINSEEIKNLMLFSEDDLKTNYSEVVDEIISFSLTKNEGEEELLFCDLFETYSEGTDDIFFNNLINASEKRIVNSVIESLISEIDKIIKHWNVKKDEINKIINTVDIEGEKTDEQN